MFNKHSIARSVIRPIYNYVNRSYEGSGGGVSDPLITVQPVNAVVAIGEDAVFDLTYTGTEPITIDVQEYKV